MRQTSKARGSDACCGSLSSQFIEPIQRRAPRPVVRGASSGRVYGPIVLIVHVCVGVPVSSHSIHLAL